MSVKLSKCPVCGGIKLIGSTKRACKTCRIKERRRRGMLIGLSYKKKHIERKKGATHSPPIKPKGNSYEERNQTLASMGFLSYSAYLASPLWLGIRKSGFALHGNRCSLCDCRADILHHLSYSLEVLQGVDLSKLTPLCDSCHKRVEFKPCGRKRGFSSVCRTYLQAVKMKQSTRRRCMKCGNDMKQDGTPCRVCDKNDIKGSPDDLRCVKKYLRS